MLLTREIYRALRKESDSIHSIQTMKEDHVKKFPSWLIFEIISNLMLPAHYSILYLSVVRSFRVMR